jgi:ubiquitin-conjugating enzyme (huntingtin interacting protein 2)
VAQMYKNDIEMYKQKAAEWTQTYAIVLGPDTKVAKLMEMGFPEDMVRETLERFDFDENLALNALLGA